MGAPRHTHAYLHSTLEQAIRSCGQTKVLASAFLYCFDYNTKTIFYLNCGHPAAIYFDESEKTIRFLNSSLDLLGCGTAVTQADVKPASLNYSDTIVIYTDGLFTPSADSKISVGPKKMVRKIATHLTEKQITSQSVVTKILDDAKLGNSKLEDDVTVISLRVT